MGVVWRARDEQLGRDVAIKELRLPDHLTAAERENWIARLEREARAAASLKHHRIVTVHDRVVDPETGHPWIVMELVQGGSLADLLARRGALPPAQVALIGMQVLSALMAAHRAGITHRDIKPANILLEGDRIVLTDFGIAAVDGDATLTASGVIMGTPAFMAPEQVRGLTATAASDLWSLGATLYTAVEGHPPFPEGNPGAVLVAVATEDPAPTALAGPLESALIGLLRKDPAERLTADQLQQVLAQVAATARPADLDGGRPTLVLPPMPDQPPPPAGTRRHRRVPVILGAVLAALLAGGAVTGYVKYQDHQERATYELSHRVVKDLGNPDGFAIESEEKADGGKVRARYTKTSGRVCNWCLTDGDRDALREWLRDSPYVTSVGEVEDTHSSGCSRTCSIAVEPRGEPAILDVKVTIAGFRAAVVLEIEVG